MTADPKPKPVESFKDLNDRNMSAETDAEINYVIPGSSEGQRRNKFQIGVPSNYDKIKSLRE